MLKISVIGSCLVVLGSCYKYGQIVSNSFRGLYARFTIAIHPFSSSAVIISTGYWPRCAWSSSNPCISVSSENLCLSVWLCLCLSVSVCVSESSVFFPLHIFGTSICIHSKFQFYNNQKPIHSSIHSPIHSSIHSHLLPIQSLSNHYLFTVHHHDWKNYPLYPPKV